MKINTDIWFNNFKNSPRTICEVGTGGITSVFQCENFLNLPDVNFILVEANPISFKIVESNFGDKSNFKIYNNAICDQNKDIKYYNRDGASKENPSGFIEGVISPLIVNHGYQINEDHAIIVSGIKFSEIDDGNIDILFADIEGAEWYVLKNMISRPKIICLETHGNRYVNQDMDKINEFMNNNNYVLHSKSDCDSLFISK